ncbi:hypothetical protein PHLCEN_2v10080 [Hermanssonia centrifuga]|uniref:Uncharacterized protein n=1 Tax=Hermanssonia centrifuga TaxID=98765 RepID=A0A2R6NNV2_9APHY|nr:hypothetical protein PHLCEN_2v10080 [Hermanssonia centrifuga]
MKYSSIGSQRNGQDALNCVQCTDNLSSVLTIIRNHQAPHRIKNICVELTSSSEDDQHASDLFIVTAKCCKNLEAIMLDGLWHPGRPITIGFKAFAPLLQCNKLTSLNISTSGTVNISEDQLRTLLSSWPSLRQLILDRAGTIPLDPVAKLPLGAVVLSLLEHCRELEAVALYVAPVLASPQKPIQKISSPRKGYKISSHYSLKALSSRLSSLKQVRFHIGWGTTSLAPPSEVALYLKHLLPPDCGLVLDGDVTGQEKWCEETVASWKRIVTEGPFLSEEMACPVLDCYTEQLAIEKSDILNSPRYI